MFSKLHSVFIFDLKLVPQTGLLVSSSTGYVDPTLPDISFMRTRIGNFSVPYIPGSSVKGPIRAFCESVLRSFAQDSEKDRYACDIFRNPCTGRVGKSNGKDQDEERPEEKYRAACLACRTFGGGYVASVVRASDFFPFEDVSKIDEKILKEIERLITVRTGIKIDRSTGKVEQRALFEYESAFFPFYGSIVLKNPERWQLGLLFYALESVNEGFVRFGRNKSRGLGWVKAELTKLTVFSPKKKIVFRKGFDGEEELDIVLDGTTAILKEEQIERLKHESQRDFAEQLKEVLEK